MTATKPLAAPTTQRSATTSNEREATGIAVRSYKDAQTHTVSAGGVEFAYRDLGPRSGIPVIFLTHLAAVLDNWDPRVVDGIAAQRRVITFDNRGVGASSGSTPKSIEAMAKDAVAFIGALGFDQVDLFGFSMGGMIAQVIAKDEPQLVRKLILGRHRSCGRRGHHERDEDLAPRHPSSSCSPCRTPSSSSSSPGRPTDVKPARSSWPV